MSTYGRNRDVERATFRYCRETCPDVELAVWEAEAEFRAYFGESSHAFIAETMRMMLSRVKEVGTEKLRDALREAVGDLMDAQGEIADLKSEIESLMDERSELREQVKCLESHECAP